MSDTDRVLLGKTEPVQVLRNKLQHQHTSPGNANAVPSPIYVYKSYHTEGKRQKRSLEKDASVCYLPMPPE